MKNSVRKCTAALCLMTLCAALTACGPGGKAKETEESGTGRTEEGSEIWIDGKPGNGEEDSKGQIGTNDSSPQNGTGNSEVQGSGADGVPGQDSGARAGLIKDQTFQVSLIPLGDVTFASYGPDPAKNPLGDVVFRLEKDGQVIDTLEGVYGDNIRSNEIFNHVEAVSFPDYNSDGYSDIISICSYSPASGPEAGTGYSEARIYRGSADGSFVLEKDLSDAANSAVAEKTVKSILGFLGVGRGNTVSKGPEWKQAYIDYIMQLDGEQWQGYNLIYIDNDDIPELVKIGNSEAVGCSIASYAEGKVQESQLSRLGFSYIERENLLCNSDGNMDHYYDVVYRLENGRLVQAAAGYYVAEDNSAVRYDENQEPVYQYQWNGAVMTREEYNKALNAVYDTSRAKGGYTWNQWLSREEVIQAISAAGV